MQKVSQKSSTELFGRVVEMLSEIVDDIFWTCRRDDLDVCQDGLRNRRRLFGRVGEMVSEIVDGIIWTCPEMSQKSSTESFRHVREMMVVLVCGV